MYKITTVTFLREDPDSIKSFEKDSRSMWLRNAWLTRSYVVSSLEALADVSNMGQWVINSTDDISAIIAIYYDAVSATKFSAFIKTYVSLLASKIEAARAGQSITDLTQSDLDTIASLSSFLESINPQYWKAEITQPVLTKIFNLWLNLIMARLANEWAMDTSYMTLIEEETTKLADIFSEGIVSQRPDMFTIGAKNAVS